MSKMYENYLELKMKSKKVMYLFKCGKKYVRGEEERVKK